MRRTLPLPTTAGMTPPRIAALLTTVFGENVPKGLAQRLFTVFLANNMCFQQTLDNGATLGSRALVVGTDENKKLQDHFIAVGNQAVFDAVGGGQTQRPRSPEAITRMTAEQIKKEIDNPAIVSGFFRGEGYRGKGAINQVTRSHDFGMEMGTR